MPTKIFISYRRGDEPGFALALYTRLQQSLREEQLFMDVEGKIPPGSPFPDVLKANLAQCDALLALIGDQWLLARDEAGRRRLDDPDDWVRIEIESAFRLGKRVVPVLVNNTRLPLARDLPRSLEPLTKRQAVRLTQERFTADTQNLITLLEAIGDAPSKPERSPSAETQSDSSPQTNTVHPTHENATSTRLLDALWIGLTGSVAGIVITLVLKQSALLESMHPHYVYLYIVIVAIIVAILSIWKSRA